MCGELFNSSISSLSSGNQFIGSLSPSYALDESLDAPSTLTALSWFSQRRLSIKLAFFPHAPASQKLTSPAQIIHVFLLVANGLPAQCVLRLFAVPPSGHTIHTRSIVFSYRFSKGQLLVAMFTISDISIIFLCDNIVQCQTTAY